MKGLKLYYIVTLTVSILYAPFISHATEIDFYGHLIHFNDHEPNEYRLDPLSYSKLEEFDKRLDHKFIEDLAIELTAKKTEYNLDDIGLLKLLDLRIGRSYEDHNRQTFLKWKVLRNMGYDVLLVYAKGVLDCFGSMNVNPLEVVYIHRFGNRYNNLNFTDRTVYGKRSVYPSGYPGLGEKLKFDMNTIPRINRHKSKRDIRFTYNQVHYSISARGNRSLMEYYNDLPQLDFSSNYIQPGFSPDAQSSVISELRRITSKMSKRESIGLLLTFVQSAFAYKPDFESQGREKYNFPEETLFATYSDCEDRSLLLAGLVREILDLNSVALYFEDDKHMSLAIEMEEYTNGFSFIFDKKLFVACEPTGRSYRFGQSAYSLERITKVYKLY
jgi:hypothetical protein